MSLQDIRLNLEDPPLIRSERDIRIRIFISDLRLSRDVLGVGGGGSSRASLTVFGSIVGRAIGIFSWGREDSCHRDEFGDVSVDTVISERWQNGYCME